MNKPLRPTAEAIEAALSAYQEGAVYNDDFEFIKIMSSNDILKAHLHGLTDFLTQGDLPELEAVFPPEAVRLLKVNMLCNTFFWVGWYSRGAIEEAEQLKRLVERSAGAPKVRNHKTSRCFCLPRCVTRFRLPLVATVATFRSVLGGFVRRNSLKLLKSKTQG